MIYPVAKSYLLALLRCASWLVPRECRNDWLAEWQAELIYVLKKKRGVNCQSSSEFFKSASFCLGSFVDALWLSLRKLRSESSSGPLRSPRSCLLFLSALMTVCCLTCRVHHRMSYSPFYDAPDHQRLVSFALQVFMALMVVPATTSFSLGDYSVGKGADFRKGAWRLRAFLFAKFSFVMAVAYSGALGLTRLAEWFTMLERLPSGYRWIWDSPVPVQSLATILITLFGLRWALRDQRRRCPVCLGLLGNPAFVGNSAHIFLAWSGTESICRKGHGLLYVPEVFTSWFHTQRWQYLDSSWSQLFPERGIDSKA